MESTGEKFTLWGWGSKMGDTPSEFTGFPMAELGAGVEKRGPSSWARWAAQPPWRRQWLVLSPGTNGCCSARSATCLISGLWTCSSGSVLIDVVKICKYVKLADICIHKNKENRRISKVSLNTRFPTTIVHTTVIYCALNIVLIAYRYELSNPHPVKHMHYYRHPVYKWGKEEIG